MTRSVSLGLLLALTACKPTIILEQPEPEPPASDPAADPLLEQEAVREAVRQYTAALARHDGEAAATWVVGDTFHLYEDLRIAALRGTREQLEKWDLMSVLMVLQIRTKVGRSELEALDGRGLFEVAVSRGLVGEDLDQLPLDEVWLDEARTSAELRHEGVALAWLRKGEAGWQLDIPALVRSLAAAIDELAREQVLADGKLRTAYTLLELSSDEFIDIEVLSGPLEL